MFQNTSIMTVSDTLLACLMTSKKQVFNKIKTRHEPVSVHSSFQLEYVKNGTHSLFECGQYIQKYQAFEVTWQNWRASYGKKVMSEPIETAALSCENSPLLNTT